MISLFRSHRVRLGWLTLLGVVLVVSSGCARRYVITTTSGAKVVTASKPRLVESRYVYKDAYGEKMEISVLRVRVIEPYSKEAEGRGILRPELQ
jgi:hypothetical protein